MSKYSVILCLYRIIFVPVWLGYYAIKCIKNPSYRTFFLERFSIGHLQKHDIWIHAASVGEAQIAIKIRHIILNKYPSTRIVISCITPTAKDLLNQKNIPNHYMPMDLQRLISKWLRIINPSCVVFVESEIWPNALHAIKKHGIPTFLVNARISDRSYPRMLRVKSIYSYLLNHFTLILPSTQESYQRLVSLGYQKKNTLPVSNLKNILIPTSYTYAQTHKNIIVLASTHQDEEALLKPFIENMRKHHRVVIIPRHPERAKELNTLFKDISFHSTGLSGEHSLWIIDKIGLTMQYFEQACLVVMGGSFIPIGGHNPLEPALFAAPVVTGPYVNNFKEMYQDFLNHKACIQTTAHKLNSKHSLNELHHNLDQLGKNGQKLTFELNKKAKEPMELLLDRLSEVLN